MRRVASALGAAAVSLLLVVPQVLAVEEITSGAYEGTRITTTGPVASSSFTVDGVVERTFNLGEVAVRALFSLAGTNLGEGCTTDILPFIEPVLEDTEDNNTYPFSAPATATCNGTYHAVVKAQVRNSFGGYDTGVTVEKDIVVAARPQNITGVTGTQGADSAVTIRWAPSVGTAPDFLGYQVERQDKSGKWVLLAKPGPAASSYVDTAIPDGGGKVFYRVLGRRSANPGEILSEGGGRVEVTIVDPDPGTSTSVPPGTTDGGTPGADGGTPGADGGTAGTPGGSGSSGGGGSGRRAGGGPRGRTGIGRNAPRIGTAAPDFPDLLSPDSEDNGFDEELPFDQGLPGEDSGDLASLIYEEDEGRGMAVPVATGFVLAAWAFHLRFLARASRPVR